jgi:hypothetical protein
LKFANFEDFILSRVEVKPQQLSELSKSFAWAGAISVPANLYTKVPLARGFCF